ncbi:hypothetical protein GCM10010377_82190 [Streptomyces viridiviolaceus]|nr:hypothetical protein GCM10010377_82190 [Streptomyces viridiviolaceus]
MGEGVEALGRETLGQHHQVRGDVRGGGQTQVGVGEQALHGLDREPAGVPGGEAGGAGGQAFIGQGGVGTAGMGRPFRRAYGSALAGISTG